MQVVLIEWDGKKPPTTYYNRLESIGLVVRGNKEDRNLSPMVRREMRVPEKLRTNNGDIPSIIFQEGAVMCSNEQLARTVAQYAHEARAKNVVIVSGMAEEYAMDVNDAKVMNKLENMLGRRGRPAKDMTKQNWTVTCHDECAVYRVEDAKYVPTCPRCHSPNIFSRVGDIAAYAMPTGGDIFECWKRLRFSTGRFEVCEEGQSEAPPIFACSITGDDFNVVCNMERSKTFVNEIAKIESKDGRKMALKILDAVFTARNFLSDKARRDARLNAVLPLYEKGVLPTEASIIESPNEYDMLDGSHVDPKMIASVWMRAIRK